MMTIMSAPGPEGLTPVWRPPIPTGGWPSWSNRKRVVVVATMALLFGAAYGGIKIYETVYPDYTYSILDCSVVAQTATVEFAVTNEQTSAASGRSFVVVHDRYGKEIGVQEVYFSDVKPHETLRRSQTVALRASDELATCDLDRFYED
jgi:hypothetical protein